MLFCVIICYIQIFFVPLCYFLNTTVMTRYEFLNYAADAWVQMFCVEGTSSGRSHCGFNLPDGGRVYFEYRGGRNNG